MDPLVATVIGIAGPYLAKGAEEFTKAAGKAAFDGAKALVARLSKWWDAEPVAAAAAKGFASDPKRYGKVLADQLDHDVGKDPALASELRELVDRLGPQVEVIQRIEVGDGITGADIGELVSGSVRVEQQVRDAKNVTGVRIGRIG